MIYIAEILDGTFVKIGYAENVEKRIASLQTGCPFKINIKGSIDGSIYQEKEIHKGLSWAFLRGGITYPPNEWYLGKHPMMSQFLSRLKYGANQGLSFLDKYSTANRNLGKKWRDDLLSDYPNTSRTFIQKAVDNDIQKNNSEQKLTA